MGEDASLNVTVERNARRNVQRLGSGNGTGRIGLTLLMVSARLNSIVDEQNSASSAGEKACFIICQEVALSLSCNIASPKLGNLDLLCDKIEECWISCYVRRWQVGRVS